MNAETPTAPAAAPQPLGERLWQISCDSYIVADQIGSVAHGILDALDDEPQSNKDALSRAYCLAMVVKDLATRASELAERVETAGNEIRVTGRLA